MWTLNKTPPSILGAWTICGRVDDPWTILWTIRKKIGIYGCKTPPSPSQKPPISGRDLIGQVKCWLIGSLNRRQHAEDMQYIRVYGRAWADGLAGYPVPYVIVPVVCHHVRYHVRFSTVCVINNSSDYL